MDHTKLIERTRRAFSPQTDFGEAGDAKALEIFERMLEHSEAKKAARTMLDFVENHEHLIEVFTTKFAVDYVDLSRGVLGYWVIWS